VCVLGVDSEAGCTDELPTLALHDRERGQYSGHETRRVRGDPRLGGPGTDTERLA
jgi:hypothetical protein